MQRMRRWILFGPIASGCWLLTLVHAWTVLPASHRILPSSRGFHPSRGPYAQPRYYDRSSVDTTRITSTSEATETPPSSTVTLPLPSSVLDDDLHTQIDRLVDERGKARWQGDYALADQLRMRLETEILLPHPNMELVLEDIPRRFGGGSTWKLQLCLPQQHPQQGLQGTPHSTNDDDHAHAKWLRGRSSDSVLNLAHACLGMAAFASEHQKGYLSSGDQQLQQEIVTQARQQLQDWHTIHEMLLNHNNNNSPSSSPLLELLSSEEGEDESEQQQSASISKSLTAHWMGVESRLDGRKAADAAFWFALAGVQDDTIFNLLTMVVGKELARFGERPSCRAKDILAVVDRLAAAGVRDDPRLEEIVDSIMKSKDDARHDKKRADRRLCLHSDSCALMIWKFSTKQRKQRNFLDSAADHWKSTKSHSQSAFPSVDETTEKKYDWNHIFEDPSRPLVVDVGCGMGVSLLGLSTIGEETIDEGLEEDWTQFNFLGNDLGSLAIGYGNNIAKRWELTSKLHFTIADSTTLLKAVAETYPGPVAYILVQFPTPYRLTDPTSNTSGNLQLPTSALEGFMVSPELLQVAAKVLNKNGNSGKLLLQSNCEDVALYMRDCALELGHFELLEPEKTQTAETIPPPTQRTLSWVEMGGSRAFGKGWWSEPVLLRQGRTETEVACMINNKPVHRCVLLSKSVSACLR